MQDNHWLLQSIEDMAQYISENDLVHLKESLTAARRAANLELGKPAREDPEILRLCEKSFLTFHGLKCG